MLKMNHYIQTEFPKFPIVHVYDMLNCLVHMFPSDF